MPSFPGSVSESRSHLPLPTAAITLHWEKSLVQKTDELAQLNYTSRNALILRAMRTFIASLRTQAPQKQATERPTENNKKLTYRRKLQP